MLCIWYVEEGVFKAEPAPYRDAVERYSAVCCQAVAAFELSSHLDAIGSKGWPGEAGQICTFQKDGATDPGVSEVYRAL